MFEKARSWPTLGLSVETVAVYLQMSGLCSLLYLIRSLKQILVSGFPADP